MKSERIKDKIDEIEAYLGELSSFSPESIEEYISNPEKKAACERYFERIVEAAVDIAFLIIKEKNMKIPEEDKQAFDILGENCIIELGLANRLKDAKGMRNILAHEYGKIDDGIVFHSVTEELQKDMEEFVKSVKENA